MSDKHLAEMWDNDEARRELKEFRDQVRVLANDPGLTDREFHAYALDLELAMTLRTIKNFGEMAKAMREGE